MKFYFRVSNETIAENLKKGVELQKEQVLDVDFSTLSPNDRELLLRHLVVQDDKLYAGLYKKSTTSGYFGRKDDSHYGCVELNAFTIEGIIKFYREIEAKDYARKKEQEDIVLRANKIKEKFNGPDFSIYLQHESGIYNHIHVEYKGVNFTPGVWTKLPELEEAVSNGEFDEWLKKVDEKKSKEAEEKARLDAERKAKEEKAKAGKEQLLNWAKENGSELLKLRIKHDQNWLTIAEEEWAVAHTVGDYIALNEDIAEEWWKVKNATFHQLQELEKAQKQNPDHDITIYRCRIEDEYGEVVHKTFLDCNVQTPVNEEHVYLEIKDVSENED